MPEKRSISYKYCPLPRENQNEAVHNAATSKSHKESHPRALASPPPVVGGTVGIVAVTTAVGDPQLWLVGHGAQSAAAFAMAFAYE